MVRASSRFAAVLCFAAAMLSAGCAGGNRLFSNRSGQVESGRLDLSKIPVRPAVTEYVISQGDALDILFLYNGDFNQTDLKVRPDGRISLPYAGDVMAAGVPVSALDSMLTARFSEIIVNPEITVIVRSFRTPVVYVLGQVQNPGGYEFKPGMTLSSALAVCGTLSPKAKRSGVIVIRRVAEDRIVGMQVDVKELFEGRRFDLDIPLQAFDIVYVPKSAIGTGQDFALAMTDILVNPAEIYLKGWQIANINTFYNYYKRTGQVP